jgi:hypothetical protein
VQELFEHTEMAYSLRAKLRMLPDLERLVARVRGLAGSPSLGVVPMAAKKVHDRRVSKFLLFSFSSVKRSSIGTWLQILIWLPCAA